MKHLNEMIKQERMVRGYIGGAEYWRSQKKKQYAYMEFRKNGIRVIIKSKPCESQEIFCTRADDKLLNNAGVPMPKAVKRAYGIKDRDILNFYKEGRSKFWINKEQVEPVDIRQGETYDIDLSGMNLKDPEVLMPDANGTVNMKKFIGGDRIVLSADMHERMVMHIRPAASVDPEELKSLVTEKELKELYGPGLTYLPYSKITFITARNRIPRWFVEQFGGSLDCYRVDGGVVATPVSKICPFTREKIDYTEEKPVQVTVSEETNAHLNEAAEAVGMLLTLKKQYEDMEALVEKLKKSEKKTKCENEAYRKFLIARNENPDNILLANL